MFEYYNFVLLLLRSSLLRNFPFILNKHTAVLVVMLYNNSAPFVVKVRVICRVYVRLSKAISLVFASFTLMKTHNAHEAKPYECFSHDGILLHQVLVQPVIARVSLSLNGTDSSVILPTIGQVNDVFRDPTISFALSEEAQMTYFIDCF